MRIVRTLGFAGAMLLAACGGLDVNQQSQAQDDQPTTCVADHHGHGHHMGCDPNDTQKTTICHLPPGNPGNEQTLCVGNPAVPAHLAHGDYLGPCDSAPQCSPDDGGQPESSPDMTPQSRPEGDGGIPPIT